ncbi:Unknown protein sequence [Pseudomonas syringae pv. cilantro]|uniref:Uncharacterized protein n=1 Tax=Pseudomonas syringae pv. cilantro TaxID=81035 RepID=A0A0N0GFD8_PSESX|nr:Unknown protein sequence [Pseudomonas syringae pv. cilantro]
MVRLDVNLIDVHAVAKGIDAVIDMANALAIDFDIVKEVRPGIDETAA